MLITFTSKVHPDVVMFGDIAQRFLKAMGQSEHPPGILRGENIRLAADRLRDWLGELPRENGSEAEAERNLTQEEEAERKNRVSLKQRAVPLLDLLDASRRSESDVIWR